MAMPQNNNKIQECSVRAQHSPVIIIRVPTAYDSFSLTFIGLIYSTNSPPSFLVEGPPAPGLRFAGLPIRVALNMLVGLIQECEAQTSC